MVRPGGVMLFASTYMRELTSALSGVKAPTRSPHSLIPRLPSHQGQLFIPTVLLLCRFRCRQPR